MSNPEIQPRVWINPILMDGPQSPYSSITVDAPACGEILAEFGMESTKITETSIYISQLAPPSEQVDLSEFGLGAFLTHPITSKENKISLYLAETEDPSQVLVEGLSLRADHVTLGEDALSAEKKKAEKDIMIKKMLPASLKTAGVGMGGIIGGYLNSKYNILPNTYGVSLALAGTVLTGTIEYFKAKTLTMYEIMRLDAIRDWPIDNRALERGKAYSARKARGEAPELIIYERTP